MKKTAKIFSVLMTLCLLCGIVALAVSASAPNASTSSDLVIPAVKDEKGVLISGNYAYNDGTNANGWYGGNGASTPYFNWDTSKGYTRFSQNTAYTIPPYSQGAYLEWKLSDGDFNTAGMYKMNLKDYGYSVLDFEYGTDSERMQIGYHVHFATDKKGTVCQVEPMYKTFVTITDEELRAAIDANYATFKADVAKYQAKGYLADVNAESDDYKWDISKAKETRTLALIDGSSVYLIFRSVTKSDLTEYNSSYLKSSYLSIYINQDKNGNWYLGNDKTYAASTARVRINDVNDFKHITMISKPLDCNETTGSFKHAVYVDGVFMFEKTFTASANYVALFLNTLRQDIGIDAKCSDMFAVVFDNLSINYYAKDYTSGDALGIDDLFGANNAVDRSIRFYDLVDTVYNKNFKTLNGAVTAGDTTYNVPELAYAAIAALKGNATISSTMPLYNLAVDSELKSLTINTTEKVTFSEEALSGRVVDVFADKVVLRAPDANDKFTVNWLDTNGKTIATTEAIRDHIPESGLDLTIAADYVDVENGTLYDTTITGWKITVDGKVVDLRALTLAEVAANKVINATPVYTEFDTSKTFKYFIGIYDEDDKIVRPAYGRNGSYDNYATISVMDDEVYYAESGSTLVLLSDVVGRAVGNFTILKDKTISIDLNGHMFNWTEGAKTTGSTVIKLGEGATVNVYSSRPGAKIVTGTPSTTTNAAGVYTDYQVHAQYGFITIPSNVDGATANIGAFRGYAANLEYTGGCVAYAQGDDFNKSATQTERGHLVGGGQRVININGGSYYFFTRTPYGSFTTTGPDFVVNVTGAKFYTTHASYSIFHDYGTSTATTTSEITGVSGPRFDICSTYTITDCEFLAVNVDDKSYTLPNKTDPIGGKIGGWTKVFHEVGANSKVYISGTKIVGQVYGYLNGHMYLGGGNVIATTSAGHLAAGTHVHYIDGVKAFIPANDAEKAALGNLSLSFAHPLVYNNFDTWLELKEGSTTDYVIKDGVFDTYVTASAEKQIYLVTVTDYIPSGAEGGILPITWLDQNGNVYKVTYAIAGSAIDPIPAEELESTELNNGWYDLGYSSWINKTEGQSADSLIAAAGKNNVFSPKRGLVGSIDGVKAMFVVSVIEYEPNLYVPKPAADSGITFKPTESGHVTGFYYSGTRSGGAEFNLDGVTYHKYSTYLGHSEIAGRIIEVVFIVDEYDVNGDGVITDDEKNIQITDEIHLSSHVYAKAVIEHYPHGSDEANLAYEMARYDDVFSAYVNGAAYTTSEYIEAFYAAYEKSCTCEGESCQQVCTNLDSLVIENTDCDTSALSKYAYGASFSILEKKTKPRIVVHTYPVAEGETLTVVMSINTYKANGTIETKHITASHQKSFDKTVTINGEDVKLTAMYANLPLAYVTDGFKITITHTDKDGNVTTVEGTYSLGAYVEETGNLEVTRALYSLSLAARDYKLVTRDEVK